MTQNRKWFILLTGIIVSVTALISLLINALPLPPVANSILIPLLLCLTFVLINATISLSDIQTSVGRRRVLQVLPSIIATVPFTIAFVLATFQQNQLDQLNKQIAEKLQKLEKATSMQLKQFRMGYLPKGGGTPIPSPNYRPLENALQNELGIKDITSIDNAKSYTDVVDLLIQRKIEMAWLGALSYLYAVERGQPRILLAALDEEGPAYYYSCIITKGTSGVRSLQDLKNLPDLKQKEFTIVDELSTSGYLMARHILKMAGIDLWQDLTVRAGSGSHEQVLQDVFKGATDLGAISSVTYNRALSKGVIKEGDIIILNQDYQSKGYRIPYGPLVLRKDIQDYDTFHIEDAFLTIAQDHPDVFNAQNVAGLVKITDRSYNIIRDLVTEYHVKISKDPGT